MDWEDVVMEVREFIREYLSKDEPVIHEEIEEITSKSQKEPTQPEIVQPEQLGEVEKRIVDILEEYVAPAVESDGGNIRFVSYKEGTVSVLFRSL